MSPSNPTADAADRTALRRSLLQLRQQLEQRAAREAALERALEQALQHSLPRCIGAYCAIRGEFDPLPQLQRLQQRNPALQLALPRADKTTRSMVFAAWRPGDTLLQGAYGISEPTPQAPTVEPDLLLLPCVGFAPNGLRLGYGGGYYDRYLASRTAVRTIGLAFEACRVEQLRTQAHDRLLDLILTESARYGQDARD